MIRAYGEGKAVEETEGEPGCGEHRAYPGNQEGTCMAEPHRIRLLRMSGPFMRGLERQDEELDLVPEAPRSYARLSSREVSVVSLWQCGENRSWWGSRKTWRPGRGLLGQS